jgi:hypothetical protein
MSDEEVVARAVELAERILDEVTVYDQNWRNIAVWADELAAIARSAARPGSRGRPRPEGS